MKFLRTLYDKTLYQEALSEKMRKPQLYWLLLVVILTIANIGYFTYQIVSIFPAASELVEEIPEFEINNGLLDIDERVELVTDEGVIIIDDEYSFDEEDFKYNATYFVATEEGFYVNANGEKSDLKYSDVEFLKNTDKDQLIEKTKDTFGGSFVLAMVLFYILGIILFILISLPARAIGVGFYSLINLLISSIFKKKLSFNEALKITLYSITWPLILRTAYLFIFGNTLSNWIFFFLMIGLSGFFISQLDVENTEPSDENTDTKPVEMKAPSTESSIEEPKEKKKLGTGAIVGIGCAGLVFIGLIITVVAFILMGSWATKRAEEIESEITIEQGTEESATEEKVKIYEVGEEVVTANLTWTVTEANNLGSSLKSKYGSYGKDCVVENGNFIEVYYKAENTSTSTVSVGTPYIYDSNDREFSKTSNTLGCLDHESFYSENVNPGITKSFVVVYEVPDKAEDLHLKIGDIGTISLGL